MPDVEFKDLVIDVTAGEGRAAAVARFWATALGQELVTRDDGSHFVAAPEGSRSRTVWIDEVPESAAGKSRVHIDLRVVDGDPAPLLAAGAAVVREPGDDHEPKTVKNRVHWDVTLVDATLADPEGNEFCVFDPR
jgi:hypothetical protein